MSSILNQTREVLKVELTKYGRKLLSSGFFKPEYYSFFDNSIIYDYLYYNITENTNEIEDRILNNSITLSSLNNVVNILDEPLGTSALTNDYVPAWKLNILNGEISYNKEDSTYYKNKFILSDIVYHIKLDRNNDILNPIVDSDYILIDLQEINASNDLDNFEIEIVTFDEISGGKKIYLKDGKHTRLERKLLFTEKRNNVIDDILYEDNELPNKYYDIKIDESHVSYYYDIEVDDEINFDFIGMILRDKNINPDMRRAEQSPEEFVKAKQADEINRRVVKEDPKKPSYEGPVGEEC